jgi:hypothetical protein
MQPRLNRTSYDGKVTIWGGVKLLIDREVERTGLTPTEVVNFTLMKLFGIDADVDDLGL